MFKRLFQAVVFFFAVYAFVFVPLGRKTALEHVRAIAGTPAAKNAASELSGGVKRLMHELRNEARRVTEAADEQMAGEEGVEPEKSTEPEKAAEPGKAAEPEKPVKPARERRAVSEEEPLAPSSRPQPAAAGKARNSAAD